MEGGTNGVHMQYERNWKVYNKKLISRGEVNIGEKVLRNWNKELRKMNKRKEGHKFQYPNTFILFLGLLKINFGFTYRKITGFIHSIAKLCPLLNEIPDYTTLFRRMNRMKLDISESIPKTNDPLFISIDASGLKADHGGSWLEKRFGRKKRKWIKIHFAIDVKSKRVIELSVTTDRTNDNKRFRGMLRRASRKHRINKVAGDPYYDDYKNYELCHKKRIRPVIKPKNNCNPDTWSLTRNKRKIHRLKHILLYKKYSYKIWKKKTGYNYRTLNESVFSAFKADYGEGVSSKKFRYVQNEVRWKAYAYNLIR